MESKRMTKIGFLWATVLMTAVSNYKNIKRIANFDCLTDYDKQFVCFWEVVNSSSNCREDFRLNYTDYKGITNTCQTLENDHYQGFRLLDKCVCNITLKHFIALQNMTVEVEAHGQTLNKTTIHVYTKVKPKTPFNVHVNLSDPEMGVVSWDINYTYKFIKKKFFFQVQIFTKEDHKMALENNHTQEELRYRFSKRQLTREDHIVRIRAKPAEGKELKGIWSEWSPEVVWRNEYSLTIVEISSITIPVTCLVILCLVLSSYFSFYRCKKKWWNNIPDPAKSKMYQDRLRLKQQSNADGNNANICCSCLNKLINGKKKTKSEPQMNISIQYLNGNTHLNNIVFKPRNDDVESCVELCPKANSKNIRVQEKNQDSIDDHLFEGDLSIARMFCDILGESSDIHLEALRDLNVENNFGIFCWPDTMDSCTEDQMKENELHQELGYHCHSSKDFQTKSDDGKTLYLDSLFNPEKDHPMECKEKPFISNIYNSFNNNQEEANTNSEQCSISVFCLDSFSESTSSKTNFQRLEENPHNTFYYNNKYCLLLHPMEDSYRTNLGAQPKISHSTLLSLENPSSCDQIVQQSPTSAVCQEPRFERSGENQQRASGSQIGNGIAQQCAPTYVGKKDRYQLSDQTIQQYDFTPVCQVFEYKHFEQEDQQSGMSTSTDCLGFHSEYQPFQSLVSPHENGCLSIPDSEYRVGDSHCQNNPEPSEKK
ncbi:interleukin-4 receptor subunit alpha-like [Lithobates pipiens]